MLSLTVSLSSIEKFELNFWYSSFLTLHFIFFQNQKKNQTNKTNT